jgi:hypothetical protein
MEHVGKSEGRVLEKKKSPKGKGKVHPGTGHEGPCGGRSIALLFL